MPLKLESKASKIFTYLIQRRDRVVTQDELFEKLLSGECVTESALTRRIVKPRQAVHDDGAAQRVIKTVHRYGCRFFAAVETCIHSAATHIAPAVYPTAHKAAERPSPTPKKEADKPLTGRHTREGECKMDDPRIAKKRTYWESNGQVTRRIRAT
jgi:DNA-binding winged helix-turn-helix (wHTH) protein